MLTTDDIGVPEGPGTTIVYGDGEGTLPIPSIGALELAPKELSTAGDVLIVGVESVVTTEEPPGTTIV